MGGRGGSSGRGRSGAKVTGGYGVSASAVRQAANDYINSIRREDGILLDSAKITQAPNRDGYAKIDVSYTTDRRILYGFDMETNTPEYGYEKEYSTDSIMAKVRKKRR